MVDPCYDKLKHAQEECSHHGACDKTTGACQCDNGYYGTTCETEVTPCEDCFQGSKLITPEWATVLNEWVDLCGGSHCPAAQEQKWALCYSSFTDDNQGPSAFHSQCGPFDVTLSIAHTSDNENAHPRNYTFGGFAMRSWNWTKCCQTPHNWCDQTWQNGNCMDRTASGNFLFGLWPGPPIRVDPVQGHTNYQKVVQDRWQGWGGNLDSASASFQFGWGPTGNIAQGRCSGGGTYGTRSSVSRLCGMGESDWGGETNIEVFRPIIAPGS